MDTKIKFIRVYHRYSETICEIIYKSGRIKMVFGGYINLPLTAVAFLEVAKAKKQIDQFHGEETIYKI